MSNMNTPVNGNGSVRKRIANETIATAPRSVNWEQENVIKKLEEALDILRQIEIKNEDCFAIIDEPLNDFLFNLKYLPTDPSFDILPTEIKTDIFSYLCDSGAFVAASVCLEWKDIMKPRLKKMDEVKIGVHCSNEYECEDIECFMPEEVLKASIALKSDVPLSLCHHLPYVDSKLIAEGLASASSLSIKGRCDCRGGVEDDVDEDEDPILTRKQFKELFKALDHKSDVMNSLKLIDLDLTWLNQNRLTNFLLSVTRSLTLDEGEFCKEIISNKSSSNVRLHATPKTLKERKNSEKVLRQFNKDHSDDMFDVLQILNPLSQMNLGDTSSSSSSEDEDASSDDQPGTSIINSLPQFSGWSAQTPDPARDESEDDENEVFKSQLDEYVNKTIVNRREKLKSPTRVHTGIGKLGNSTKDFMHVLDDGGCAAPKSRKPHCLKDFLSDLNPALEKLNKSQRDLAVDDDIEIEPYFDEDT